jgi:hypothetical protein
MTAMENFNRTQELHMQRERDLAKQVEGQLERIQSLSVRNAASSHNQSSKLLPRRTDCRRNEIPCG